MDLRPLDSIPFEAVHVAFCKAFSDYSVPFDVSLEQLREMQRRRGVRLDLSVGAFDGQDLVGFTCNGLGAWQGQSAGYDSGTGVTPVARGRGLASLMMEQSLELLSQAGASRYLLEVIQTNQRAFHVYEGMGFRITRDLLCWSLNSITRSTNRAVSVETASSFDTIAAAIRGDWEPSWQNSIDSVSRAAEQRTCLVARVGGEIAGYALLFDSGDLAQFAVVPSHRRRGVGTTLLSAARAQSSKPLRIINTDAGDAGTTRFLASLGAAETVRQYEMILEL